MMKPTRLFFLVCLFACALILLLATPLRKAQAYSVLVQATAFDFGDDNYTEQTFSETDGMTSLTAAVGPVTGARYSYYVPGASGNVVESRAGADLATGQLRGFVSATMNSGDPYNIPGRGESLAEFRDSVTFDLPDGMTSALIGITMTIDGTITNAEGLVGPYGCNNVNGSNIQGYLYLGGSSASTGSVHPCGLLATVLPTPPASLPFELSVEKEVTDGQTLSLIARFILELANNQDQETVEFDFGGTAGLEFNLPAGATFTSQSGVLLTIPEPTTAALLGLALVGLALRRRLAA